MKEVRLKRTEELFKKLKEGSILREGEGKRGEESERRCEETEVICREGQETLEKTHREGQTLNFSNFTLF